jgi:hypothetical protein
MHLQIFDSIFLPRPLLQKYVEQHLSTNDVIITIGFIARNSSNEQKRNGKSHPHPILPSFPPLLETLFLDCQLLRIWGQRMWQQSLTDGTPGDLHEMYLLENQNRGP